MDGTLFLGFVIGFVAALFSVLVGTAIVVSVGASRRSEEI